MSEPNTQQSNSDAQKAAVIEIRERLSKELGVELKPKRMWLDARPGPFADVDGVAPDESVLVEISAHHGALKGGQRHKVSTDALKLAILGRTRPKSRLIIAFCDQAAADGVVGWRAEALEAFGIEKRVVDLAPEMRAAIVDAQALQRLLNRAGETPLTRLADGFPAAEPVLLPSGKR